MAVIVSNIVPPKYMESSQTTQYTSQTAKTVIDKFTVTNITAGNVQFSVHLVPAAGAADASNRQISNKVLAPNECYLCPELVGQTLENGAFISTLAGAATSLNMDVSGRIIT